MLKSLILRTVNRRIRSHRLFGSASNPTRGGDNDDGNEADRPHPHRQDDKRDESYDKAASEKLESSTKQSILKAAMNHIPEYGFSMEAIRAGCIDEGLSPAASALFDKAEADLIYHFMDGAHDETMKHLSQMPLKEYCHHHDRHRHRQFSCHSSSHSHCPPIGTVYDKRR